MSIYPFGSIIQIGDHVVASGDIQAGDAERLLSRMGVLPDITYSDPPWGVGLAKQYRNKAQMPNPDLDWQEFVSSFLNAIKVTRYDCFIEMGKKWSEGLLNSIGSSGGTVLATYDIVYYRTRPCDLHHVRWGEESLEPYSDLPTGLDDEKTPQWALSDRGATDLTVFDPCMGKGLTAKAAVKCGHRVLGMELNPERLSHTISFLESVTESDSKVVGNLYLEDC